MADSTASLRPETAPLEAVVAALGDVFQALARPDFQLPQVLQIIIERAVELCRADAGDVAVREASGFCPVAFVGIGAELQRRARYDYGAVGNVVIQASRLSDAAQAGQILISQRLYAAVESAVVAEPVTNIVLKGISKPITAFSVRSLTTPA